MKMPKPKDVDAYIASSDKEARPILEELRKIIKSTIPKVEEGISWNVPFYKYHGELVGFATYKKHVSFGIGAAVLQSKEREMLEEKGYKTGKGTIQIRFDQKVPTVVVKRLLKAKAKMNEVKRVK
ncbi:MAG: iron chaperone [Candidatus Thorarchaeota archaeon]